MTNDRARPVSRTWRRMLKSGACSAMVVAAACGGSPPPQAQTDAPSPTEATSAAKLTEKPFDSGGSIDMQLEAGNYVVRPGPGNAIRVTLSGDVGAAKVDVSTEQAHARVAVKDTPRNNFQATIDVPQTTNLVIRLTAGELKVEAITGNKDIESNAGNVRIVAGDSKDYASVDASVKVGDINAAAFGESRSGIFPSLTWSGPGKYTLRARLIAGNLTLSK